MVPPNMDLKNKGPLVDLYILLAATGHPQFS